MRLLAACLVALLLPPGVAVAQGPMPPMSGMPPAGNPASAEMMAGMKKMQSDMAAAPMTGDADRDFVAMMIPHHQGAIDMAQTELKYGRDPQLRRLARDIVAAQAREITQMKQWQARHGAK